jgi:hypothetical protein
MQLCQIAGLRRGLPFLQRYSQTLTHRPMGLLRRRGCRCFCDILFSLLAKVEDLGFLVVGQLGPITVAITFPRDDALPRA